MPRYSSKLKELPGDTGANWLRYVLFSRKNLPQIRVTSYAFVDVNNKIGLYTEKQRQIILINVIKLGSFNTPDLLTYDDLLI